MKKKYRWNKAEFALNLLQVIGFLSLAALADSLIIYYIFFM